MGKTDSLAEFLEAKRSSLVKQWLDAVFATYSHQAAEFMRSKKDRFDNPVGSTFKRAVEDLYDNLRGGFDPDAAAPILDGIVRIRAIQDFAPSDSLAFIFQLKGLITGTLGKRTADVEWADSLAELMHDIDRMALLAFDLYVNCRNQLADIRIKEMERANHMAWRRAGLLDNQETDQPVKTGG